MFLLMSRSHPDLPRSRKKASRAERARQTAEAPPGLATIRDCFQLSDVEHVAATKLQATSPLCELAKELRLEIYKGVFGCPDAVVHIAIMSKRLGGIPCWRPEHCIGWQHDCWGLAGMFYMDGSARSLTATMGHALSLPLTCKKIYDETMAYLYACNTFNFRHLRAFMYFRQNIVDQSWHRIRSIEIDIPVHAGIRKSVDEWGTNVYPGDDPAYLPDVCRLLGAMGNLERLSIRIGDENGPRSNFYEGLLPRVLAPLLELRVRYFTVMIPQQLSVETRNRYAHAPFDLLSHEDEVATRLCPGCECCPPPLDIATGCLNF